MCTHTQANYVRKLEWHEFVSFENKMGCTDEIDKNLKTETKGFDDLK